jgi:phosphotransferase system  glucose/maltose/N-acetylglucosamine-specific IIC component
MVMDDVEKKSLLLQGLVLAAVPAILFVPAFALFTICPPEYATLVITFILIVFAGLEILAGWNLSQVLGRPFDWMSGSAVVGLLMALIVLFGVAWGFIAPELARRAGY